ncbi:MAG TPA: hypothetical protein VIU12_22300 [Chryseolinea sp.]
MATYDIDSWANQTKEGKNIFIWDFLLNGSEFSGWKLYDVQVETSDSLQKKVEYYCQNSENKAEAVKIDVIQNPSWQAAQKTLLDLVKDHMAKELPPFSASTKRSLGDVAYTGTTGIHHVLFSRANIVVVLNTIGDKDIDVAKFAEQLDGMFTSKPESSNAKFSPDIYVFELVGNKSDQRQRVRFEVVDPVQNVWLKFFCTHGQFLQDSDGLSWLPGNGDGQITLVVTNSRGFSSSKTINTMR